MNNRQIRDALSSAFIEAELSVRVKHARSTDSVYMTVSSAEASYVIRIANHEASYKFSKIEDYWVDTSKSNVIPYINAVIKGGSRRFGISIPEFVPEVREEKKDAAPEKVGKISDYSCGLPQKDHRRTINLDQYRVSARWVAETFPVESDPEPVVKTTVQEPHRSRWSKWDVILVVCSAITVLVASHYKIN